MTPDAAFYLPSRAIWIWLRGAFRRVRCGQRFGHFPAEDWAGNSACARCGTRLL
jgi:hypothetical protein